MAGHSKHAFKIQSMERLSFSITLNPVSLNRDLFQHSLPIHPRVHQNSFHASCTSPAAFSGQIHTNREFLQVRFDCPK
jgi:hypothetical protein